MKPEVDVDERGNKFWHLAGRLHREDGPAVESVCGCKEWWLNGELHRVDGPAVEIANGSGEWFLNGRLLTKEEWFNYLSVKNKEKNLFTEYFSLG